MWTVYIPKHKIHLEADEITMNYRLNAVSTVTISFHDILLKEEWLRLAELLKINERVRVQYNDDVYFRGYVQHVSATKTQSGYQLQATLYDPLGKLVKITFSGGISLDLQTVLQDIICDPIGITNMIDCKKEDGEDIRVNLRYDSEVPRYTVLLDACTIARYMTDPIRFGFYYNHQENALCELNDSRFHKLLKSISNENRLSINQSYGYVSANRVIVTNIR